MRIPATRLSQKLKWTLVMSMATVYPAKSIKSGLAERELAHISEKEIETQSKQAHDQGLTQDGEVELADDKRGNDGRHDE